MKRIEIIIPHRMLADAHGILKEVNVGGMSHYRIEGSGRVKAQPVTSQRGTSQRQPELYPKNQGRVVVRDKQVEELISKITDRLSTELGGKIFVVDVPIAVDLATKKRGEDVI